MVGEALRNATRCGHTQQAPHGVGGENDNVAADIENALGGNGGDSITGNSNVNASRDADWTSRARAPISVPIAAKAEEIYRRKYRVAYEREHSGKFLAIESLVFIGVHVKYHEVTPIIMSGVLGLIMAFIAYGRMVLHPIV
jgi:hypothetical protein